MKRKKLNSALTKLKNLSLESPDVKNIQILGDQKNQLEIEKQELEEKYKNLKEDYNTLTDKLQELNNKEKIKFKKEINFLKKLMN